MLLIIDNYDSFTYNLYQLIASYYAASVPVILSDQITVAEIMRMPLSGIILSPGPGRPENAGVCVELVQTLVEEHTRPIPLLGVCLGHQAIVTALGGAVIQAAEIIHGKPDLIYHHNSDLYHHLPTPFQAGRYHSLIAERETLPPTLIIEAQNKDAVIMGIKHKHLPLYGVQFHPESILTPQGSQLLTNFITLCQPTRDAA